MLKFNISEFHIRTLLTNLLIEIFYGFIPLTIYMSTSSNSYNILKKISDLFLDWHNPMTYFYLVIPIIIMFVYFITIYIRYLFNKYLLNSNFQPIYDFISNNLDTIIKIYNDFSIDVIKSLKKLYLIYFGTLIFCDCMIITYNHLKEFALISGSSAEFMGN